MQYANLARNASHSQTTLSSRSEDSRGKETF